MRLLQLFRAKNSDQLSWLRIGVVAVAVLGIALWIGFRRNYDTVQPRRGPIVEAVYGLGTVTPKRTLTITSGVPARIEEVFARPGDSVARGAPLLRTDSTLYRAPFAGAVTVLRTDAGEIAMPGNPLLSMRTESDHHIELRLDQESVLRIRPGLKADLSFETLRSRKINGEVSRVYSAGGEFIVEVESDEMPAGVLPDMTADVAIEVARRENALLVPQSSVRRGQVTTLRNGLRKNVPVEIGAANDEWVEITGDSIAPDDRIVVPRR